MKVFISTFVATVLIALGIGYFSLSLRMSNAMVEAISDIADDFKERGINFDYSLSRQKASFSPRIYLNNARISFLENNKLTAIEIGKADITFDFFSDYPLNILFGEEVKFITYDDEYLFLSKNASIGISFFDNFKIKDFSLKAISVSLSKNFETVFLAKSFGLFLNKNIDKEGFNIELDANGIDIFKEKIDGAFINALLNKDIEFSMDLNKIILEYKNKGGVISILKGAMVKEDLKIAFDGSILFDEDQLPYIILVSSIYNLDYGLLLLEKRGIITQKEHWLSKVILFGLAKKDESNESFIPTEIVVKKGKIYVGPILFYDFGKDK